MLAVGNEIIANPFFGGTWNIYPYQSQLLFSNLVIKPSVRVVGLDVPQTSVYILGDADVVAWYAMLRRVAT